MANASIPLAPYLGRPLRIGTAGWAIPKAHAAAFADIGSGLERYATIFNATEINSTFYRSHRSSTLERWRDSVPQDFQFSVKVSKRISHEMRLVSASRAFQDFAHSLSGLGDKLGPLLLQLPPKLVFDPIVVEAFLKDVANLGRWQLVVEPRHETWFSGEADDLLTLFGIARVGADPPRAQGGSVPGGSHRLEYLRLHGSPQIYFSAYDPTLISKLASQLLGRKSPAWCIFDNTASGAAIGDALALTSLLNGSAKL